MSQIEKVLVTSLEASEILGCNLNSVRKMLRSYQMFAVKSHRFCRLILLWPYLEVVQIAQKRAAARGVKFILPKLEADPLEGLVYTTPEVENLLGVQWNSPVVRLEELGVLPVRRPGKGPCLWLKTDIEALKTRLETGAVLTLGQKRALRRKKKRALSKTTPSSGIETAADRADRVAEEFLKLYGAYPYERPDLVSQWCEMLGNKAV